jgi:hypothetical protein
MSNPEHEIVRRIIQFSSDVVTSTDLVKRRSDQSPGARDTGYVMTGIASIFANVSLTLSRVAAIGQSGSFVDCSLTESIAADERNC